ncbi:hypothetical protein OQY15_01945 [Pedobacter sp. MC2016-15]|uniref:hypothetical protein n=1 Tax=Pedobacter sp. MC2016-15 TaxID=2994473 RepID=UPI002247E636|nr:hypothetical protein [Pedobacter sp. MC2016-15]MCX2477832.1 hypothetical protein [Pedobacter sp. MC2016-15]
MGFKILRFIFFGNYFVGLLAVALTIESTLQLGLPFNSLSYYTLLFLAPIIYYTYAYMGAKSSENTQNPRTAWYGKHHRFIYWSQISLSAIAFVVFLWMLSRDYMAILQLPLVYWITVAVVIGMAILYYGLVPVFFFNLNLRNTGWLKPFIIGFIWAATANLLPLILLKIESAVDFTESPLWFFLFIKNWMFCTVNAIMFDMKDYEIDSNAHLKTFTVRIGIRKTIFYILIPLLLLGILSLLVFAYFQHFAPARIIINLIPFILTLLVAYSMDNKKNIFYYLIVIDGLIMVKAICGSLGMLLI